MNRWQMRASLGFASGVVGSVVQGLAIVLCSALGLFILIGVPLEFEGSKFWFYERITWGGIWGLFFALPLFASWPQWRRGLIVAVIPALATLFWFLPFLDNQGWMGLKLGTMMPVVVIVFNVFWGLVAGWWLGHTTAPEDEE